ncbi:MAG: hypothetical protein BAJALOKI1v1_130038 [Promethearchaeota archaeon]|nr:MAG: hypothetical protein BAJALOKI1v1_130038 [Candidatus Lokiarchaeota archaeon]
MALYTSLKKEDMDISMFIDLDKKTRVFYNNMYLEDFNIVIKMPLPNKETTKNRESALETLRIEKFELTKYIYLLNY